MSQKKGTKAKGQDTLIAGELQRINPICYFLH